jgi:hypothetical protein
MEIWGLDKMPSSVRKLMGMIETNGIMHPHEDDIHVTHLASSFLLGLPLTGSVVRQLNLNTALIQFKITC